MKIIFAGSPQFAVPVLQALYDAGAQIIAVITQPDKPTGRKKIPAPTPVKLLAGSLGIPVYDFEKIRLHADDVRAFGADIMITCAYGQLLTQEILDCFPRGVWNTHASLLPEFRGASPIQSAVAEGKEYTGITVMKTELSLDSGGILLVKRCPVGEKTYGELEKTLSLLAAEAATEAVALLEKGDAQLLIQDEAKATYCKKITKADGKINFENSAEQICRLVRAMNPEPVAYCMQGSAPLNILLAQPCGGEGAAGEVLSADKRGITVACGGGAVLITELVPAGGKRMRASDYVNGRKIKTGDKLD